MLKSKKYSVNVRRVYSEDFKREAVSLYEASDKSMSQVCKLLDISAISLLGKWRVLYGKQHQQRGHMKPPKNNTQTGKELVSLDSPSNISKSDDAARIASLEEENRQLRRVLSTHAVREYLAELREESWREMTDAETAKEVERRVAKKR